jgi:hypothetical protein
MREFGVGMLQCMPDSEDSFPCTQHSKNEFAKIRARIYKHLRSQRIDSKEAIPPAYVGWRAGTITLFLLGS